MRQVIRLFGWTIRIFWVILLVFSVTAAYSAFQIRLGFGEPYASIQGDTLTSAFPFFINNAGFYDISGLNITTLVKDYNGSLISDSSTFLQRIPRGSNISVTHNVSIELTHMTIENLSHLFFHDSSFDVTANLTLNYANAIPLQIATNFTLPWGAPLHNLNVGDVSVSVYNATHVIARVPLSFENHALFSLNGTIRLEFVDNQNRWLGSGTANINVPPQSSYRSSLDILVLASTDISEAHLFFDTSIFSYGPMVIALV